MAVTPKTVEPLDPDTAARPGRIPSLLLIVIGGAVGTTLRAALEAAFPSAAGTWPWATFVINVAGAFILALLLETLSVLGPDEGWSRRLRLGVGTGLLGGFTTYSTFMVEAARLARAGEYLPTFGYVTASVALGVAAAWAGMALVSTLHRRRVATP